MKLTSNREQKVIIFVLFLVIFFSLGWVTDSGAAWLKICGFLGISGGSLFLMSQRGINLHNKIGFLFAVGFILFYVLMYFIHGRQDDISIALKIAIALLVVLVINSGEFIFYFIKISNILFYVTTLGFLFTNLGLYAKIPDIFMGNDRFGYYITLSGAVSRETDLGRASGIFWEPGVLGVYSIVALFFRTVLCGLSIKSGWREIIQIILSQSIGGLISLIIFAAIKFYIKNIRESIFVLIVFVCTFIFSIYNVDIFLDFIDLNIAPYIYSVFGRDLATDESFFARSADFFIPFLAVNESIFFGFPGIEAFMSYSLHYFGQTEIIITNSISNITYFYGYVGLFFNMLFIIVAFFKVKNTVGLAFVVPFIVCICFEPILTTLFYFVLLLFFLGFSFNEKGRL